MNLVFGSFVTLVCPEDCCSTIVVVEREGLKGSDFVWRHPLGIRAHSVLLRAMLRVNM